MPSNHVQRAPEGAAAALLPGLDFSSSAGTHRNLSAVNETETVTDTALLPGLDFSSSAGTHRNLSAVSPVGAGATPVVSSGRERHRLCRPDGAAPVVSSGRGRHRLCRPDGADIFTVLVLSVLYLIF